MQTSRSNRSSIVKILHFMRIPWVRCINSSDQYCIEPFIEATIMYQQLYMIDSCFGSLDHTIILTLLRAWVCPPCPYVCHILFVSHPLMGTNINTKPKSPCPESGSTTSPQRSYDVHHPYDELLPSHIMGQFVNPKNSSLGSTWPTRPKDTHARPLYHSIRPLHPQKGLRMKKRA